MPATDSLPSNSDWHIMANADHVSSAPLWCKKLPSNLLVTGMALMILANFLALCQLSDTVGKQQALIDELQNSLGRQAIHNVDAITNIEMTANGTKTNMSDELQHLSSEVKDLHKLMSDFGGVYTSCWNIPYRHNARWRCSSGNPQAGGKCQCPPGYTAVRLSGGEYSSLHTPSCSRFADAAQIDLCVRS